MMRGFSNAQVQGEGRETYGDTTKASSCVDSDVHADVDTVKIALAHCKRGVVRVGELRQLDEYREDAFRTCTHRADAPTQHPFLPWPIRKVNVPSSVGMKMPMGTVTPKLTMTNAPITSSAVQIGWMTGMACVGGSSTQSLGCVLSARCTEKRM